MGGYLDSVLNTIPGLYFGLILLSFAVVTWGCVGKRFDVIERSSLYIICSKDNPVQKPSEEEIESESKDEVQPNFATELRNENILDEDDQSLPSGGNLISKVKKARQKAIRDAVEREMTAEEKLSEQRAASEMLAR